MGNDGRLGLAAVLLSVLVPVALFFAIGGKLGTLVLAIFVLGPPAYGIWRNLQRRDR